MQRTVTTIINYSVVDEVCCTPFDEDEIVDEKHHEFQIALLRLAGVDAGVYVKRESKMNYTKFEKEKSDDIGPVNLLR